MTSEISRCACKTGSPCHVEFVAWYKPEQYALLSGEDEYFMKYNENKSWNLWREYCKIRAGHRACAESGGVTLVEATGQPAAPVLSDERAAEILGIADSIRAIGWEGISEHNKRRIELVRRGWNAALGIEAPGQEGK